MPVTSWTYGATVTVLPTDDVDWDNPELASDGDLDSSSNADATKSGEITHTLEVSDFGFTFPGPINVLGVEVRKYVRTSRNSNTMVGEAEDYTVVLYHPTPGESGDRAISELWPYTAGTSDIPMVHGGAVDDWDVVWTQAQVEDADFSTHIRAIGVEAGWYARIYEVEARVHYELSNTAPVITAGPAVDYGDYNRAGPENTPVAVTFTATDAEETAVDGLSWMVEREYAPETYALVTSGTCTSGVPEQVNIAYNAIPQLVEGSNLMRLTVSDGSLGDTAAFSILIDNTPPTVGTITVDPDPIMDEGD